MPAQLVVRQDPRKVHQRVFIGKIPIAQSTQGIVRGLPHGRRINDQQRATLLAVARRDQQRARSHVPISRQRGYAQKIEIFSLMQSEHAGVVQARADQVVVSERRAIIAIRIRVHIRGGKATGGIQGSIRPLRRHFTDETNQRGLRDRLGEVAFIGPRCGNPLEYLLVIDLTGTLSTHPLHGEVEYVRLICRNIVEVDAGPQKFAGTRPKCLQLQRLRSGFQG